MLQWLFNSAAVALIGALALPVIFLAYIRLARLDTDIPLSICHEDRKYWSGKVVWLTGASSGIGRALARELALRGAFLVLSARREDTLHEVAEECTQAVHARRSVVEKSPRGSPHLNHTSSTASASALHEWILVVPMDMNDTQSFESTATRVLEWKGRVDVLVNNAGVSQRSLFPPFSVDEYMLKLDLLSHIALTKTLLPTMLTHSGHIINTCSAQSRIALPGRAAYCAAKHGLLAYFKALALELKATEAEVRITNVLPGYVHTELNDAALRRDVNIVEADEDSLPAIPRHHAMTAERCAKLILRAATSGVKEAWIAKQPELAYMYMSYYWPNLWGFLSSRLAARLLSRNAIRPRRGPKVREMRERRKTDASSLKESSFGRQIIDELTKGWGF